MHFLFFILYIMFTQTFLYSQNDVNNALDNKTNIENPILKIKKVDAQNSPSSFIILINTADRKTIIEYANQNDIYIEDSFTDSDIRKAIVEKQLGIFVEVLNGDDANVISNFNRGIIKSGRGKVYLRAADIIERYVVEATDEEIIILHGNIDMLLLNYNLLADRVIYSLSNGEVYADGNLKIQNDDQKLEGGWFLFNRDQNKGILSGGETQFLFFKVRGDSIKFFDEKFFADDSYVSFSKLTPTAHDFLTSKVYAWDNENILIFNAIYKVGEQPLFYFPLFIQNKFGTGIITSFGESAKEGVYVQNHKVFNLYGVSHKIRFDVYQRLGFLIGDEITFKNDTQDVSLDAMFALGRQYYLLDSSISSRVGFDTRYVNYFNNGEPGKLIPRYRFDYDHTMLIYKNDNISSSVSASLLLLSDLYFQSDFGNIRPQFDVLSFFTTVFGGVDDVGNSTYESYIDNSIRFNNNFYGINVSILADLQFEAIRNLSASELNTNFDYYRVKPSRVTLPSLNLSYGNVIGRETSYYMPNWNINYNLGASYAHTIDYRVSSGVEFENNTNLRAELFDILAQRHAMHANAGVSRGFSGDFTSFTPSLRTDYNQQITMNPEAEDLIFDERNTYFGVGTSMGFSIFMPNSTLSDSFKDKFTPTVRLDNTYNLSFRFREEYTIQDPYGVFQNHSITSRFRLGGTGYSLFFIPDVNLSAEGFVSVGYDLRPEFDSLSTHYSLLAETNRFFSTEAGFNARLYYDKSYISGDIRRNLVGTNYTSQKISTYLYFPIPIDKLLDLIIEKSTGDYFFDGENNDLDTYIALSYGHDFINYRQNKASVDFGINLLISKLWAFKFVIKSENNRAYRYIPEYAERENEEWVNPFFDIVNSFDFSDAQKRTDSLFKLGGIETSIWHDVDGWEIMASFSLTPSSLPSDLATGSIKGTYWDKQFWITFTMSDFAGIGFPTYELDLNSRINNLRSDKNLQ